MSNEQEQIDVITEYAKSLSSEMLCQEFIETLERGLRINNSGTFKIAIIFMNELDRRGYGSMQFRAYRDLLQLAVTDAGNETRSPSR